VALFAALFAALPIGGFQGTEHAHMEFSFPLNPTQNGRSLKTRKSLE
jgi:hypothetical protein